MTPIQFITHHTARFSPLEGARLALQGGCRWIQLRMKDATDEMVAHVAEQLLPLCREAGATCVIDDRVELALRLGADGVHLGRHDMPVSEARRLAGSRFIIGGTANTIDDVRRLAREGADYIGCGPYRFTTTKKNLSPVLGLEGYRAILAQMRQEGITLPLIAIGGIELPDVPLLMQEGVSGIAVSGSVLRAEQPAQAMRQLLQAAEQLGASRPQR